MSTVSDKKVTHHRMTGAEYIEHHGVKGQKWGIRNSRIRNARDHHSAKKAANAAREAHIKNLSDEEINKYIRRLELEKKYKDLSSPQKTAGKKYAHELAQNSGKAVVGTVVSTTAAFAIKRALSKTVKEVATKAA